MGQHAWARCNLNATVRANEMVLGQFLVRSSDGNLGSSVKFCLHSTIPAIPLNYEENNLTNKLIAHLNISPGVQSALHPDDFQVSGAGPGLAGAVCV